ncbi:TMV resistance protein N-like [Dorcoceras hygrometricum]|uniref:TMV resistance protein N-like n=1 Tax=Dorcoceras hygrometricum TaxID=472368 RepID=A0A2Z7BNA8_9LAMI|nr:TMV resistance protein N-like [Dorcoceras hygrometricum]
MLAAGFPNDWLDQTMSYQLIQTTSFAMHHRLLPTIDKLTSSLLFLDFFQSAMLTSSLLFVASFSRHADVIIAVYRTGTQNGDLPADAPLDPPGLPADPAKANTDQSSPKTGK